MWSIRPRFIFRRVQPLEGKNNMADWLNLGVGLLNGIFGGGQSTPGYVIDNYKLQNDAFRRAMELYDQTNLEQLDNAAIAKYSNAAIQNAMTILSNYDAQAASAGSPLYKSDTQKVRARGQIAADTSIPLAQFAAQLLASRPQRQAALLPNPSQIAGAGSDARYIDAQNATNDTTQWRGLLQAAHSLGSIFADWQRSNASPPKDGGSSSRWEI